MVLKAGLGERLGGGRGGMICHRPRRQAGRRGESEEGASGVPSQVGAGELQQPAGRPGLGTIGSVSRTILGQSSGWLSGPNLFT